MSRAESLYRLQLLDLEIDQAKKHQREIEAAIAENPAVTHARQELSAAQKAAHAAQAEVNSLELDAGGLDERIKASEDRLYGGLIKNPKELLDTERDLSHHRRHKVELEERLLNAMLVFEEARAAESRCEAALRQVVASWKADNSASMHELASVRARIDADAERRAAAVASIPRGDIDLYAALRAKKNGVAVATIRNGACSICGEQPSSTQLQQARVGNGVVTCTTCGRILYGA